MKSLSLTTLAGACVMLTLATSCAKVQLEGGDKPIHIVHDINIRIDRQLDDFFAFEKQLSPPGPTTAPAASQPA